MFEKKQVMRAVISIFLCAVFMFVAATDGMAQETTGDDDAIAQSPVCFTHKSRDATGECRIAFMRAAGALKILRVKGRTLNEAGLGYVSEYMSKCHCLSEFREEQ